MNIGPYQFQRPLILAPMAGSSDLPFRIVCRRLGAAYAVAEMVAAREDLWNGATTCTRLRLDGEPGPRVVQIVGAEPGDMARAARGAVSAGADVVDINMGCPSKRVCRAQAGSALLADEARVRAILEAVCAAVDVPVTLKTRTGVARDRRNGPTIARIAEDAGVAALTVHGRTRACRFRGHAEYDTIAVMREAVRIPVIANGDITDARQARHVLSHTGAHGLMIGRAAVGNPWLYAEIAAALDGRAWTAPDAAERAAVMSGQIAAMHALYGEGLGLRVARKHVSAYLGAWREATALRARFNALEHAPAQRAFLRGLSGEPLAEAPGASRGRANGGPAALGRAA